MVFYAGPLVKKDREGEDESQFEIGPPVKKKEKDKGILERVGDILQSGSSPGKEFAERQKARDAEATGPVTPTDPQAREPMPENLQLTRQPDPEVGRLQAARQSQAPPAEPAPPPVDLPGPEVLEPTEIPSDFTPPPRPEQAFHPRNVDPVTGAPYTDEEWARKSYADDAKLRQFRRENSLPEDFSREDYNELQRTEKAEAAKNWLLETRNSINKYFEDNPITGEDLVMGLRQANEAKEKAEKIEAERENMIEKGLLAPDPDVDMEAGAPVSGQAEGAQGEPVEHLAVDPDTGERVERDLTGDEDKGFLNQFVGRAVPGTVTNYNNLKGAYWRTNFLLGVAHDSNQRKTIDSVLNQLAEGAHPGDPQKQEAYKVRAGQEISDLWDAGAPVHRFFNEQAAKVGVHLREDPMALVAFSNPPANMDELREKSAKGNVEIEKELKDFYQNNPEYQLPSDWNQLTDIQREIKYPGIFWGENVFSNSLNSVASIGTYMATAAVTRNHAVAALLAGSILYPQFVDEIAQEIDAMEREEGIKVPDELKAQLSLLIGIPSALAEGLGERIGFGPALTAKFSKQYTKKALKNRIVKLIKGSAIAKKSWQTVGKPGVWMGKQYMAGGLEEGTQQGLANVAAQIAGSERSVMKGVGRAAYVGGPVEALLAGGGKSLAITGGKAREYMVKKKGQRTKKQIDRLIKDYEDQTAEDVLMDDDLSAEEAADRETYEGDLSLAAEEAAAEFTEEELEGAGKKQPADKVADFEVETEEAGPVDITVTRRADGTVTLIPRAEGMSPIDHNAEFAKGKSAPELIAHSLEPLGVKKVTLAEDQPAVKAEAPKPKAAIPATAKGRMDEGKAAQVRRLWGKPELVGGGRKAPTRTEPPWKKPAKGRETEVAQVKGIWKGKRAPRPGGIIDEISTPPAKTRITPTTKRKVFDTLAKKLGKQAGAKIRFDHIIYQNERPIGLQMTITSGPAKGAPVVISDRAHKTIPRAQEYIDTIIMAYDKMAPRPTAAKKPRAISAKQQYDDLIKGLTPEQRSSVLDLIKDPDMKLKEKLGLIQADLATLDLKRQLQKDVKAAKKTPAPGTLETLTPDDLASMPQEDLEKIGLDERAKIMLGPDADPKQIKRLVAQTRKLQDQGKEAPAAAPPKAEGGPRKAPVRTMPSGLPPKRAEMPTGGGRKAPIRTTPSGPAPKKRTIPEGGPRKAPVRTMPSELPPKPPAEVEGGPRRAPVRTVPSEAPAEAPPELEGGPRRAPVRTVPSEAPEPGYDQMKDKLKGAPKSADLKDRWMYNKHFTGKYTIWYFDPSPDGHIASVSPLDNKWEVNGGSAHPDNVVGKSSFIKSFDTQKEAVKFVEDEFFDLEASGAAQSSITNYFSGANRIGDMKGHIAAGVPIGVEIAELSKNGEKLLIQYLKDGGQAFIDSGAFGAFMNGTQVNWPAVLKNYQRIADAAGDGAKNLVVVAPDVIGDAIKSIQIADKYRAEINAIAATGAKIILPVHRPAEDYEGGLRGIWQHMENVMDEANRDNAIAGFPSNKFPIEPSEYEDIFKATRPPKTVHLLGISPKRVRKDDEGNRVIVMAEMVEELRRLDPNIQIIADANRLRSQAGRTLKPAIYSARAAKKANEEGLRSEEEFADLVEEYVARDWQDYADFPGDIDEGQIKAIAKDQGLPDAFADEFILRVESGALSEAVKAATEQGEWAIEEDLDFKVFYDILSLAKEQIEPAMTRADLVKRAVEWEKEKSAEAEAEIESTGAGEKGARKKAKKEAEAPAEDDLIERYRIYERELDKKIKEHGNLAAAETHALAASGLMQEGVAAARGKLGLTVTFAPGTPLMAREKKEAEAPETGALLANVEAAPLVWSNTTPEPTPANLPTPNEPTRFGFTITGLVADGGKRVLLPDGTVWEYKGISGYKADNVDRVNGWMEVTGEYPELREPAGDVTETEEEAPTPVAIGQAKVKGEWLDISGIKPIKRGKDKGKYWADIVDGKRAKVELDDLRGLDGGEFEMPGPPPPPPDLEADIENITDEDLDKMLEDTGEAPEISDIDKETEQFYNKVLKNRTDLTELKKLGIESTAEADNALARMKNGATKADALYSIDQMREEPTGKPSPKKTKKRAPAKAAPAKKLTEIMEEAAKEGMAGAEDALSGLYDLFGGTSKLSMGFTFDEDTYAKAKPKFQSAYEHMVKANKLLTGKAKKGIKDFFKFFVDQYGNTIKPYIRRFVVETRAALKALKERGNFQNVGYVWDPEDLARGIRGKTPKSAVRIIADKMQPSKIWKITLPKEASYGLPRVMSAFQKNFRTFKEFVEKEANLSRHSTRRTKKWETRVQNWLDAGHEIEELQEMAGLYGTYLQPIVNTFSKKTSILEAVSALQTQFGIDNLMFEDGSYPDNYDAGKLEELKTPLWENNFLRGYKGTLYDFLINRWQLYLANENEILLSEIDIHNRTKNAEIIRTGLPDYRKGKVLTKSEDLQEPFEFKGVGYGTQGWINQEERHRVVHAAFDAFKDLAATIGAPDNAMGLGTELAVQFANLGHKARGSAAAYFPSEQTINFTRDNGDGTLGHEWSHGFHRISPADVKAQVENLIEHFQYWYDFEAGVRLADEIMDPEGDFMKRLVLKKGQTRLDFVKEELQRKYEYTVRKDTDYYKTAQQIDPDYTARGSEMWARAFEAYLYDTLAGRNNYLVSDYVEAGRIGGTGKVGTSLVYPAGREREEFAEAISHFLDGLNWDANGTPTMKADYESLEEMREAELKAGLDELLEQLEARYKAIWSSEPSADGLFWYQFDATALAPMMQPDGYAAYDKEFKAEGQDGTGAVGYLTMLHPDDIIGYKLTNIQYDGDNATYVKEEQDESDLREDGDEALDEVPTRPGERPDRPGDTETGDQDGGEVGGEGDGRPRKQRDETDGGEGDSDPGVYPATPGNYRITDDSLNSAKNISDRFNANLAALRVLNIVEAEERSATQDEKDILAGFSGWGGMAELFGWNPGDAWKARSELIKAELTEAELTEAEKSSVSAYYTPVPVARFMWRLAQRLGFKNGSVLDPAFGANGVFTGTIPEELIDSTAIQGVEKDGLSARIARQLYEKANIEHLGFEQSKKPLNRFNLTITNIPFANYAPADTTHNKSGHKIHNYYVNKMLDLTAPGGLMMAISTHRTMDKTGQTHLKEYAEKADFVGAVRLPSHIYAATGVVTDIIVFRKKIDGSEFVGLPVEEWTTAKQDKETGHVELNSYFVDHPDMVAGSLELGEDRWGGYQMQVIADDTNIARSLADKAKAFPEDIVETEVTKDELSLDDLISAPGTIKEGGIYINDKNQVSEKIEGQEFVWPNKTAAEKKANNIGRQFIKILDQVRATLRAQKTNQPAAEIKAEQKKLKKFYNEFVKKFGPLNEAKTAEVYAMLTDAPWVTTLETYDPDTKKVTGLADIFTKKIVGTDERPDFANTDHDALNMALDEFGYPNLDYMAKLRDSNPETVLKGVLDKVIENPETGILETMDEYLAGNVRQKLKVARAMAADNPEYERNVALLEAAQPDEIPPHRITARLGASWISPDHVNEFVKDKLNMGRDLEPVSNFNPATGLWSLTFKGPSQGMKGENMAQTRRTIDKYKKGVESKSVWGTPRISFFQLMEDALRGKRPTVTYEVDRVLYIDEVATAGAEAKMQEIQAEFGRWLFADPARAEVAQLRFNDLINTSTKSHYDGAHLTFPGKSMAVLTAAEAKELGVDDKMVFYDHQVNAVWQYLRNGNLYLAHEVGAGKTMTMAMIAMEAKRLKGKKKVVYVTLNDSTMGQAVEEIKRLYPLANVMPIQVSTIEERARRQLNKMALNDFDIAIMRQQDLNRIHLSPEAEQTFIDQDLQDLRTALEEAKAAGSRILEQDIQTRILALEAKLQAPGTYARAAEEQQIFFDDLGIDLMIVDEAHAYKNIPYATSLARVTGLNPAGSKTAHGFFRKTQWLNATYPKQDGVVLASGTPLTNSIGEFFNLQRVLQPDEAKRQGQWRFDRWIANYGDIGSQLEWDGANQKFKEVITNKRIVNAGRLLATAFQNIDSVRAEDTNIARPGIFGDKPEAVSIEPNKYVVDYYENVIKPRVELIDQDPKNAEYEGIPDNMLRVISNMSMVAIDQRLLNSKKPDPKGGVDAKGKIKMVPAPGPYAKTKMQKDSKVYMASRNIYERWKDEKKKKGVQLVFADLGVPGRFSKAFKYKADDKVDKMSDERRQEYEDEKFQFENSGLGFNLYDGIKTELVKLGIPKDQIAFIHDADHSNKAKKAANLRTIFKKVNSGKVRVLFGSTTKAGTGVNVQERVSDVHHIDVWWNYSAWEQRNGRALRAGNIYTGTEGVHIWNYITEKSVDAHRWGKIFQKGKVLHTALTGDINIDVIDDITAAVMSAKEMEATSSGNPLLVVQADLLLKVRTMGLERSSFLDTVRDAKQQLASMPGRIESLQTRIENQEKSKAIMDPITAVRFSGSDNPLILKKHGKEIAAALAEAIKKTRPVKGGPWDGEESKSEPLLVFGTHKEVEVEIPALDKDGNEQKDKEGNVKTEKVKEIKFTPVTAQATIDGSVVDPARRYLSIKNGVTGNSFDLANWNKELISKKKEAPEIVGNVSRSVTNFVSQLERVIKESKEEVAELEGKKPALEDVADSTWAKADEYETAERELADIERQMADTPGAVAPGAAQDIRAYKAPVPMLEDFADKDRWKTRSGFVWPKQEQYQTEDPEIGFKQANFDAPTFFGERRKKFKPEDAYSVPNLVDTLMASADGPVVDPPTKFTQTKAAKVEAVNKGGGVWAIIDAETNEVLYEAEADNEADALEAIRGTKFQPKDQVQFWINSGDQYYSIEPNTWLMADRMVGPGEWRLQYGTADVNFLVHKSEKDGSNDLAIKISEETKPPATITGAGAPAARAKKVAPETPQTVDQVKTVVDAVRVNWAKGAPGVKIYRTQEGLPQEVKDYLKENYKEAGLIAGAYYKNTVYLIAENIGSNAEAYTTLLHEAFGHHGIRGTLGNKIYPVLRDLYIAKKREVDAIGKDLGLDMKTTDGRAQAAEEWFANQAQQEIPSKWFDRLVRAIREWIRATGIRMKLSDAEIRALIANARQFAKSGKAVAPIAGAAPAFKRQPKRKGERIDYAGILTPEQEKRMQEAKGVGPKSTFKEKAGEKIEQIKKERQHFPELTEVEDPKLRAQLADILRTHQEMPEVAKQKTAEVMRGFISNLGSDAYDIYSMNIILADMMRDVESGLLNDALLGKGETLPFGFESVDEIEAANTKFKALAEKHTEIRDALAKRKKYIDTLVDGLIKHKILKKEVGKYNDYYHHQVLQYWGTKDKKKGNVATGSADVRTHWRPWMVARKGSLLDYNTEYIEAEFVALSQQYAQLQTARVLERLRKKADIKPELHADATAKNHKRFYKEAAEKISAKLKKPVTAEQVMGDKDMDPLYPYRKKIGMARGALERMAAKGELESIDSGFSDVVQSMAQSFENKQDPENYDAPDDIADGKWFDFLAYLVRTSQPGANWAATIFKNIHARKNQIREDLGKHFLTWEHLIPEGYAPWKPEPGKGGFWVNTITDSMLRAVVAGDKTLTEEDTGKALAKGQELVWVLPTGLADTLDTFKDLPETKAFAQISAGALRAWKQYILINPMRVLKYNLNNMSGDLDIALAYNPLIVKRMRKSLRDLRAFEKGTPVKTTMFGRMMSKIEFAKLKTELTLARKLGVIGSGWSVQEVEDITKQMGLDKFIRGVIMGEKPNLAVRYWEKSKGLTTLRENILRLAAFRHFQAEIAAGKTVYGASKPQEIDAIENDTERAAKLARELVGDYGNISHSGQYIRKRMMPFYSWIEINSPRYAYMLRNVKYEGREVGARPLAIASKKVLTRTAFFAMKATMLYTLVKLWNILKYPDEEDEFGEAGRRQLHLILGRRADGTIRSIRFQGALSDTLSFFALEDFPDDIMDFIKSDDKTATALEKIMDVPKALFTRGVHALRPEPKMLYETLTGESTYPDPLSPRPIRDTVQYILRTFSLDKVYNRLTGKPGRGKNMAEHFLADLKTLVMYTSDPGEQSYYDSRRMVFDYKEKMGDEKPGGKPTNRGNALYYYKQALKYGDFKAAERYLMKYYDLKGTPKSLKQAITLAHPLSGIKKVQRHKFRRSLTERQQKILGRAMDWYRKTYQRDSRTVRLQARRKWLQKRRLDRK